MLMAMLAVLSGFLLSWFQLEGLRRNVRKLLDEKSGKWGRTFFPRLAAVGMMLWLGLHVFKTNLFAFLLSFLISGFVLRYWYRKDVHA